MNEEKENNAIEKFLPLWGQTICSIIDHFFTRREKHVVIVAENASAQIDKIAFKIAENAPTMAKAFAKATVASMNEVDAVMAEKAAKDAANTEQPN
tara:strand:- start:1 stop:288 length:288 start_codon:yes stop_codon:yes gene_type:complete